MFKGKGKGEGEGEGEGIGKGEPYQFFIPEKGCDKGGACTFYHCSLKPQDNRCFNCGGVGHGSADCTMPRKEKNGQPQGVTPALAASNANTSPSGGQSQPQAGSASGSGGAPPAVSKETVDKVVKSVRNVLKQHGVIKTLKMKLVFGKIWQGARGLLDLERTTWDAITLNQKLQ